MFSTLTLSPNKNSQDKSTLHKPIIDATCKSISNLGPCYLKGSCKEIKCEHGPQFTLYALCVANIQLKLTDVTMISIIQFKSLAADLYAGQHNCPN
jgi:hypothetical protein